MESNEFVYTKEELVELINNASNKDLKLKESDILGIYDITNTMTLNIIKRIIPDYNGDKIYCIELGPIEVDVMIDKSYVFKDKYGYYLPYCKRYMGNQYDQ